MSRLVTWTTIAWLLAFLLGELQRTFPGVFDLRCSASLKPPGTRHVKDFENQVNGTHSGFEDIPLRGNAAGKPAIFFRQARGKG